jgi:hypothetical protein
MSTLVPDSPNNCWFCDFCNISCATICGGCQGLTIPTRSGRIKLEWTTQLFDPYTSTFNSVHASLLFASIKALDDQERAAIKIGAGFRQFYAPSQATMNPLREKHIANRKEVVEKKYPAVLLSKIHNMGSALLSMN